MDNTSWELLFNRLPDLIFSVANIGFLIQLRAMSVDGEKIKKLDQKVIDLTAENEALRYEHAQLLSYNQKLEGENSAYRKFNDHPESG